MSLQTVEIYVVACRRKKALTIEALEQQRIRHTVCWTTDYKLESDWKPESCYASMVQNQVGAMRCYRGHQDALKVFLGTNNDFALILEDDAWPNRPSWPLVVGEAWSQMKEFELVSLHGRAFRREDFTERKLQNDVSLLVPLAQGQTWVQGSLAYAIGRGAAQRFIDTPYVGYPSDIFICNRFKFALIDPSPFNHDRKAGSLIDCATPKD